MPLPRILNHVEPTYVQVELTGTASQSVPIEKITADSTHSGNMTEVYDAAGVLQAAVSANGLALGRKISPRFELKWVAGQHGKPGLNALLTNSVANYAITDRDFEVLGTNMTSALCTYNAEGGIKLTTAGADNDQGILIPHLLSTCSPWTAITWGTDQQTQWEAHVKTGSAVTAQILWAGLKLTNTPTAATDNDSVYFRYQNGVNSGNWQALYSINNVDTAVDTGVAAAANQEMHFRVTIDSSRIARMYVNNVLAATTTALTDATDFIPYVGVQASGAAAAKSILVFGQAISRIYA
jgi:hypothetical protein